MIQVTTPFPVVVKAPPTAVEGPSVDLILSQVGSAGTGGGGGSSVTEIAYDTDGVPYLL